MRWEGDVSGVSFPLLTPFGCVPPASPGESKRRTHHTAGSLFRVNPGFRLIPSCDGSAGGPPLGALAHALLNKFGMTRLPVRHASLDSKLFAFLERTDRAPRRRTSDARGLRACPPHAEAEVARVPGGRREALISYLFRPMNLLRIGRSRG